MTEPRDELLERYAEAIAQDPRRPSERVRNAAHAHAQMLRDQAAVINRAQGIAPTKPAANQPQWTLSLVASLAVVGLAGLLYVQINQGAPEDREIALGTPTPSHVPAPVLAPDPTVSARADTGQAPSPKSTKQPPPAAPPVSNQPAQDATQATANVATPRVYSAAPAEADAGISAKATGKSTEQIASAVTERNSRSEARAESAARAVPAAPAVVAAAAPPPPPAADTQRRAHGLTVGTATAQLLEAARTGDISTLQEVLTQGVAINTRDHNGNTALMLAVRHRQAAAVRKLLDMGADTSLLSKEGLTALRIAEQMGFADIARLLEAEKR